MIQIDHSVYQVNTDGVAYEVNDSMKTPFAVVTFFETDQVFTISETLDCEDLKTQVDSLLPSLDKLEMATLRDTLVLKESFLLHTPKLKY